MGTGRQHALFLLVGVALLTLTSFILVNRSELSMFIGELKKMKKGI